jgi:signal transduction histidine kinase
MRRRVREFDWASTPLGPIESWPQALHTTVDTMLASALASIVLWGPELIQIYNDAYVPIIGVKHPAALGHENREVWPEVWDINGPIFERVLGGETITREDALYRLARRDGGTDDVYLTLSFAPVRGDNGAVAGVLVTMFETTSRVQAQAMEEEQRRLGRELEVERSRLEEVFRQAPAFLAVLRAPDWRFELANDAYYQLVGHRALVGRTVAEALPEVMDQGFVQLLEQVVRTGKPYVGREIAVALQRGTGAPEERFLDFVYQPLTDGEGNTVGVVAHGHDVTEHVVARRDVEMAKELAEEARREAEEANLAKSAFLTMMSHELRTPLNAVTGYSDLLLVGVRGDLNDGQREDVQRIKRSGQYLLGLINDVLNFAKLESGQVEFRLDDVPVLPLLEGLGDLIMPQLVSKGLHYRYSGCAGTPAVHVDPEKVRQILLNLLANAVKFTEPGGEVALTCDCRDDAVRITVRDTGRGIAADQLARVFDPFVQVDRHLTPSSQQGVGLGLSISRDLALGMGGRLEAQSTAGEGSAFTLILPLAQPGSVKP